MAAPVTHNYGSHDDDDDDPPLPHHTPSTTGGFYSAAPMASTTSIPPPSIRKASTANLTLAQSNDDAFPQPPQIVAEAFPTIYKPYDPFLLWLIGNDLNAHFLRTEVPDEVTAMPSSITYSVIDSAAGAALVSRPSLTTLSVPGTASGGSGDAGWKSAAIGAQRHPSFSGSIPTTQDYTATGAPAAKPEEDKETPSKSTTDTNKKGKV